MEKRKTQEEKQDKNIAETRPLFIIQSFCITNYKSLWEMQKKRDKIYCAETRDYSELLRTLRI